MRAQPVYILVMGSDLAGRAPSLAPLLWAWEKGLGSFHSCSRCCTELMEGLPGSLLPLRLFSYSAKPPFHSPLKTHLIVPAWFALKCRSRPSPGAAARPASCAAGQPCVCVHTRVRARLGVCVCVCVCVHGRARRSAAHAGFLPHRRWGGEKPAEPKGAFPIPGSERLRCPQPFLSFIWMLF